MNKTNQAQAVRGANAPVTTGNVVFLAGRKTAPAPAKSFSRTDDLEPHLFEPGRERNAAAYVALVLATSHANPASHIPRDPLKALRKTRRALALLEIECDELGNTEDVLHYVGKGKDKALDDIFGALHQLTAAFNRYDDPSAIESAAVGEKLAGVMKSALKLQFGGAA